ncbi:P-loop containing nucleoside triphosphate hydrolase protein [Mycena galericulata]|nr:P-loop containing nucleoside triphosphate hydrolase protein [Mycena galericulata]
MPKALGASRVRTNALLYMAITYPEIFDDIEVIDILASPPKLIPAPARFALAVKEAPRWWDWTEPPADSNLSDEQMQELKDFSDKLVNAIETNKKDGERLKWPPGPVLRHCELWQVAAKAWDNEVDRILGKLKLTTKDVWYKSRPSECGANGIPDVDVWTPNLVLICNELFPDVKGLVTETNNVDNRIRTWIQCWLSESLHGMRKLQDRSIKRLGATEAELASILQPKFWQTHTFDLHSLTISDVTKLNKSLSKWSSQLEWTMKKSDEDKLKENELAEDATETQMADRWSKLSDGGKKVEWAGWAYGQVEALVNSKRPANKQKEIDLTVLTNDVLKAAIQHGRRLGVIKSARLITSKIREATDEEIAKFDETLTENLRVWGATEVDIGVETFRSLWDPADEDPEIEKWREETFLSGHDLGVEQEKNLSSKELCEILGWDHDAGIPAAFRTYLPSDPGASPPNLPNNQHYPGAEKTVVHWHQKVGVVALLRKTSKPPKKRGDRMPKNISPDLLCTALKQGWADTPGALLADEVGTGKTAQMLALVGTLIQLYDFQESTGKKVSRMEWPPALRFYDTFAGLDQGIPNAPHLFLIPGSVLPQFVAEAQRFFQSGAVDIFTIGSAAHLWKADWERFHNSLQKPIRRIVFIAHATLRNVMGKVGVTYKGKVDFGNFKRVLPNSAQPFNKDWLSIFMDEAHEARTGGKLYQSIQATFQTGLIRVIATATPMYQNLRVEQKVMEMLCDYTRLRNKTRKEDIAQLKSQFETHQIDENSLSQSATHKFGNLLTGVLKGFTADRIIRRTNQSKRPDGVAISQDLPPCTQVHVKVTLTPPELEAATEAMEGADVGEMIKDSSRASFFLAARKETAYFGAADIVTRDLYDEVFTDLEHLNSQVCTKLKCVLVLIRKILTGGGAQFFSEEEIGLDGLIKQDSDMGLSVNETTTLELIKAEDMKSTDKKILLHTEFAFLQNLIISALKLMGVKAMAISGASGNAPSRAKDLETFRTSPEIRVFVISNVGSAGLNIAFCSCLILYESGWSKIHTQQIEGRIKRRGQKQRSYIFQMAAEGTIDMALLANGRNKSILLKSFLSVSRNEDDEATWNFYQEEYDMTKPELIELQRLGKFKGFSLPADEEDAAPSKKKAKASKTKPRQSPDEEANKDAQEGTQKKKKRNGKERDDSGGKKRKALENPVEELETGEQRREKKPKQDRNPRLIVGDKTPRPEESEKVDVGPNRGPSPDVSDNMGLNRSPSPDVDNMGPNRSPTPDGQRMDDILTNNDEFLKAPDQPNEQLKAREGRVSALQERRRGSSTQAPLLATRRPNRSVGITSRGRTTAGPSGGGTSRA